METKKWYHNQWYTALALFAFWPAGIYGMYKGKNYGAVLLRFVGIVAGLVLIIGVASMDNAGTGNSRSRGFQAVTNSQWDGSVDVAERYLKHNLLKDPDSYQSIKWGRVRKNEDGTYEVTHTFRAKNSFGGYGIKTMTFTIDRTGQNVINVEQ